ncbi:glycoprotein 3 alpha L fucosyltransferase [Trichuris trichiura]|uniref:Fucosyltransferase n=1 Tax=Trichuris trichiura TaxID=36087 RepID=A0A077Z7X3_TRITR|nr:glycoprotein 3 alpha L fucosyltransferase [Trichuris trichiura]
MSKSSRNQGFTTGVHQKNNETDKIFQQLRFLSNATVAQQLLILLADATLIWELENSANEAFSTCPVSNCIATGSLPSPDFSPDAVIFRYLLPVLPRRDAHQIWIFFSLESPLNTPSFANLNGVVNWTATYRLDSDIPIPYGLYKPIGRVISSEYKQSWFAGKSSLVAWFSSNCFTMNQREAYVRELSRYIQVDAYGSCGRHRCRRGSPACWEMLAKKYKFYLAFENSNCRHYITEKLFFNAFQHNVIPVVMGAPREDYLRLVPPNSFIHVDDFDTPQQLAEYLKHVAENQSLYDSFFKWRSHYEAVNTRFWCRLCAMLNHPVPKTYDSLESWWRPPDVCKPPKLFAVYDEAPR